MPTELDQCCGAVPFGLRAVQWAVRALPAVKGGRWLKWKLAQYYVRKRRLPVVADVLGFRMRLDPSQYLDRILLFSPEEYDPGELAFLRRNLKAGDVFLDLGAHLGWYSLNLAKALGPSGRVLAVEADPDTYDWLAAHVRANGLHNTSAVQIGVSDATERLLLHRGRSRATNSFLTTESADTGEVVYVECRPLLGILREQGITRVDGAKLDIEGYEYRVLRRFFQEAPIELWPGVFMVEGGQGWLDGESGDVVSLLEERGYRQVASWGYDTFANYAFARSP